SRNDQNRDRDARRPRLWRRAGRRPCARRREGRALLRARVQMADVITPPRGGWIGLVAVITAIQAVVALMTRVLPLFGLPLTLAAGVPPEAVGQLAAATSFGSMVFFL